MSYEPNTRWLESARETFDEQIANGNFRIAEAVVADMHEFGFHSEAEKCEAELKAKTIEYDE